MTNHKVFSGKFRNPWIALILIVLSLPLQAAEPRELALLSWQGYMDPEIVEEFRQRTGISVKQTYFESDAARDEVLLETGGRGYDIALINGASIRILAKRGWLEPINETDIPNLKHVDPHWRALHDKAETYSVPYFWGTLGIAYRKDLVPFAVSSWMDLLRPEKEIQGRVAMISDARDLITVALKALGYSINSTDAKELAAAEALLQAQAPAVKTYKYVSRGKNSALVNGQVVMSMIYNGGALEVQEYHDEIAFVLPKEGSSIWVDYLSVLSASANKAAAKQFINFLNEPEIAAQLAQFVCFATPNLAAEALLPEDFRNDPVIYPSEEALENSETYRRLPARTEKLRATIFSRLVD
ncbi:spermidine/putrescine ABC transporter substrate-binding protein [Marinobacter sp. 2_MG-2023]|uniref:polyamine ABC transporter substrate-binding protein n=1 Tax=Marinobacter sp. 2_MG-2023 TaxID=3062679 RepID=UPI0026E2C533|nr:spermidine/putrescine ABC transporter substrate-binding protein [Marinobacter sp. 2_MG-2023]MDO6443383.1 spermidine/putrescine ABC transporter substrate-binding protein [Marinobacter sp. 2_MG-2023]